MIFGPSFQEYTFITVLTILKKSGKPASVAHELWKV